jgi:hypothetical protein
MGAAWGKIRAKKKRVSFRTFGFLEVKEIRRRGYASALRLLMGERLHCDAAAQLLQSPMRRVDLAMISERNKR